MAAANAKTAAVRGKLKIGGGRPYVWGVRGATLTTQDGLPVRVLDSWMNGRVLLWVESEAEEAWRERRKEAGGANEGGNNGGSGTGAGA